MAMPGNDNLMRTKGFSASSCWRVSSGSAFVVSLVISPVVCVYNYDCFCSLYGMKYQQSKRICGNGRLCFVIFGYNDLVNLQATTELADAL